MIQKQHVPIYVLAVSLLIRLILLFVSPLPYWYDELVFISFSHQPLYLLLDTLIAEPHPAGFFLFLKTIPLHDLVATRLILLLVTTLFMLVGLWCGYTTRLIQRYKLYHGLALFIASYTFLETTMYVKDGLLSIPLGLLTLISMLRIIDKNKHHISIFEHILPFALLTVLFFISYSSYVYVAITAGVVVLVLKKRKYYFLLTMHVAVVLVYMGTYGYQQLFSNEGRSIWLAYQHNSPVFALQKHIGGLPAYSLVEDAVFVVYIALIAASAHSLRSKHQQVFRRSVFILTGALFMLAYALHLLPQLHYAAPLYLLLSVLAGWGVERLSFGRRTVLLSIFVLLLVAGLSGYYRAQSRLNRLYGEFVDQVGNKLVLGDTIGLVSDLTIMPYVTKIGYFYGDDRLVPMQVVHGEKLGDKYIGKEHLETDIVVYNSGRTGELVREHLAAYGQKRILYLSTYGATHYYDPDGVLQKVLTSSCDTVSYEILTTNQFLYEFDNCEFKRLDEDLSL